MFLFSPSAAVVSFMLLDYHCVFITSSSWFSCDSGKCVSDTSVFSPLPKQEVTYRCKAEICQSRRKPLWLTRQKVEGFKKNLIDGPEFVKHRSLSLKVVLWFSANIIWVVFEDPAHRWAAGFWQNPRMMHEIHWIWDNDKKLKVVSVSMAMSLAQRLHNFHHAVGHFPAWGFQLSIRKWVNSLER